MNERSKSELDLFFIIGSNDAIRLDPNVNLQSLAQTCALFSPNDTSFGPNLYLLTPHLAHMPHWAEMHVDLQIIGWPFSTWEFLLWIKNLR